MKKIGVVGAGTMGSQIGLVFAEGGLETSLYDLTDERPGGYFPCRLKSFVMATSPSHRDVSLSKFNVSIVSFPV